jgi:hypothetical protein
MTDTTSTKQCIATILRLGRRCRNREEGGDYCRFHGPLCEARTLLGKPCNSMVLKFRQGFIYCDHHEHVSIESFVGPHSATKHNNEYQLPPATTTFNTNNIDTAAYPINYSSSIGIPPRTTNNKRINTTTTTNASRAVTTTTTMTTTVTTTGTVTTTTVTTTTTVASAADHDRGNNSDYLASSFEKLNLSMSSKN